MIATLVVPVSYDRLAAVQVYLCVGGAVLALFVILAATCVIQGALAGRAYTRRGKR